MSHEKVYGICENKCKVEVLPKDQTYSKDDVNEMFNNIFVYNTPKVSMAAGATRIVNSTAPLTSIPFFNGCELDDIVVLSIEQKYDDFDNDGVVQLRSAKAVEDDGDVKVFPNYTIRKETSGAIRIIVNLRNESSNLTNVCARIVFMKRRQS